MAHEIFENDRLIEEIVSYLDEELGAVARNETRQQMVEKWQKWRRQREARPEKSKKNWPWPGASNVSVPLAGINTEAAYSALKRTYSGREPFWRVAAERDNLKGPAAALTRYVSLLAETPTRINIRKKNRTILYELASIGTCFVKVPWVEDVRNFKRVLPSGALEQAQWTAQSGPQVIPIRIEDIETRYYWEDIQKAPWMAHRYYETEWELAQHRADGTYFAEGVDAIADDWTTDVDSSYREDFERTGIGKADLRLYELRHIYLYWDVDGDGLYEDIELVYHNRSGTILSIGFNELGMRPFVALTYVHRPFELYGMGIGWKVEHMQDEVDTLHNMRIDGSHLSGLRMFAARRGSGVYANEVLKPGKFFIVDNPAEDIVSLQVGDVYPSSIQAEAMSVDYAQRFTFMSDPLMGFNDPTVGTRATFAGTRFLTQQSMSLFDAIVEGVSEGYDQIGLLIHLQLMSHRERIQEDIAMLADEDQRAIQGLLTMDLSELPRSLNYQVQTTDIAKTEDAQRQGMLALTQLYTQYFQQMFQYMPVMFSQEVPAKMREVAMKAFTGGTKLLEKTFEFFGEDDTGEFVPDDRDVEMVLEALENVRDRRMAGRGPGGPGSIGGAAASAGGAVPTPGMGSAEPVLSPSQNRGSDRGRDVGERLPGSF